MLTESYGNFGLGGGLGGRQGCLEQDQSPFAYVLEVAHVRRK